MEYLILLLPIIMAINGIHEKYKSYIKGSNVRTMPKHDFVFLVIWSVLLGLCIMDAFIITCVKIGIKID